ncbi:hypothetical protein [Microbulbifer aggregans]|uniref:hypothetical protein n=1 Tax=Microbulbifer aggregans TaxID=1769779 RepID=UPI001CFDED8B|nr:hypothetical protein [Microbulbifer aggregans]
MSEAKYSVIFRGDLQPGYTVVDVKANFARLFKVGPEMVEKLFSGRPLALKKGLSQSQAEQLQATLSKLGAQSAVRVEGVAEQPAPASAPATEAAATETAEPPVTAEEQSRAGSGGLSLAPMDGNLVKEHERAKVDPVQVPVSHLSLKPAEGNLVDASERQQQAPAPVSVPDWKLDSVATFKLPD